MISIWAALGLILIGFVLVWLSKRIDLGLGDVSKAAIILLPLFLYLLATGKLAEFEGLGFKAKFREITEQSAVAAAHAADLMISSAEANNPDFYKDAFWGFCRPYYVISDKTAQSASGGLDQKATLNIARAIRSSIICGKFKALVVVDDARKPVGFFRPSHFIEMLRVPLMLYGVHANYGPNAPTSETLFEQIKSMELGDVLANAERRAKDEGEHAIVKYDATLESAYDQISGNKTTLAMITDRFGHFDGIITLEAVDENIAKKLFELGR